MDSSVINGKTSCPARPRADEVPTVTAGTHKLICPTVARPGDRIDEAVEAHGRTGQDVPEGCCQRRKVG